MRRLLIWLLLAATVFVINGANRGAAEIATAAAGGYRDVPATHWAKSAIDEVSGEGYMSGYPDRRFNPNGTITRAEPLILLVPPRHGGKLRRTAAL